MYILIGKGGVGTGVAAHLEDVLILDADKTKTGQCGKRTHPIVHVDVNAKNYEQILSKYSKPGDTIIDLSQGLGTTDLVFWCSAHERHYINAAICLWDEEHILWEEDPVKYCNEFMDKLHALPKESKTISLIQGANPGMVNHFFNYAVEQLAEIRNENIDDVYKKVREVYVLEKDTQVPHKGYQRPENTFCSTWNVIEFHYESIEPVHYPNGGRFHAIDPKAAQCKVQLSDVPLSIDGRLVFHEETISMNYYLKHEKNNPNSLCQFIYESAPIMQDSLRIHWDDDPITGYKPYLLSHELVEGSDFVGTLVRLKDGQSWFVGYCCELEESRQYYADSNATCWYASAGVLAGLKWMKENPQRGTLFPDRMPCRELISHFSSFIARDIISKPISSVSINPSFAL